MTITTTYPAPPDFWRDAEALLAAHQPSFIPRPAQGEAARLISEAFRLRKHAAIDAPVGLGKSYGMLVAAEHAKGRTVISTATKALQAQLRNSDIPALQAAGVLTRPTVVLEGRGNFACFGANERVLTDVGAKPISELAAAGSAVLLDANGDWVECPVQSFGLQPTFTLTLRRNRRTKEVVTTADHRWFVAHNVNKGVVREETTVTLRPGERLSFSAPRAITRSSRVVPSPQGIAHGIVFGDGTTYSAHSKHTSSTGGIVSLFGEKKELAAFFPLNRTYPFDPGPGYSDREGIRVGDLPAHYKELPPLTWSPSYLYGWLAGYIATDGSVNAGKVVISSAHRANLQHVRDVCTRLGIVTSEISARERTGINQSEPSLIYTVRLYEQTFDEDLILRTAHRANRAEQTEMTYKQWKRYRCWEVVSVEPTGRIEEVFCAVVPTTASFTLEGNILTGNCGNRVDHEIGRCNPAALETLQTLQELVAEGTIGSGRRDDLPLAIPDWIWATIASDGDACRALECSKKGGCAYTEMRNQARMSEIIVVNHHVLLADAAIKSGGAVAWGHRPPSEEEKDKPAILGPYQNLIIDEAHALEAAVESFGEQRVTIRGMQALSTRVSRLTGSGTAVMRLGDAQVGVGSVIESLPHNSLILPQAGGAPLLEEAVAAVKDAAEDLRHEAGSSWENAIAAEILHSACVALAKRLANIDSALHTGADDLGLRAPSVSEGAITSQLVNVAPWLTANLFDHVTTVALSGTLAVPGRRDYVAERIGLDATTVLLPTVFNLADQRLVFVTPRVDSKDPGIMSARCTMDDVEELRALIEASSGRALILFPAMTDLRFVHERLDGTITHTLLAQGITKEKGRARFGRDIPPAPPSTLAKWFNEDNSSVLLATRSFFEGVDFPGDTCSLVVITRFPNLRPDDPLTLARRRHIEAQGRNPWTSYQEPAMQLIFRQAAGRAIRRIDDVGVVAVLDPRCASKGYAKTALMALKPSNYTQSLDDVRAFLPPPPVVVAAPRKRASSPVARTRRRKTSA